MMFHVLSRAVPGNPAAALPRPSKRPAGRRVHVASECGSFTGHPYRIKVEDDAYTFEVRKRDLDKKGKPGRWKRERTTRSRAFEKKEPVALGKTTYRLGRTRLPVKRLRVKTARGTLEQETEYRVHEEHRPSRWRSERPHARQGRGQTHQARLVGLEAGALPRRVAPFGTSRSTV